MGVVLSLMINLLQKRSLAILTLALISGQLIKVPIGLNGLTILDIAVILLSLGGLFRGGVKFKSPPKIYISASLFFIFGGLVLLFSPLHLSPTQLFISAAYPIRYLFYILLALEVLNGKLPWNEKDLISVLIVSGSVLSALGLLQLIFIPNLNFLSSLGWDPHYFRTVSTFLDPNFLGTYLAFTLLILFSEKTALSKNWRVGLFALNYLALLTTFSRSAAVMFAVSFLTFSLITKSKKLFLITMFLIIGFGVSFLIYRQTISAPRNINREQSASFRLNAYQEGISIFQHSPIFGIGFNAYRYALSNYQLADNATIQSHGGSSNDSSLLYVLATTGAVGMLIYLWFLLEIFKTSIKSKSFWGFYIISILFGLLVNSLFINTLFYPWMIIWLLILPALIPKK
jgi:hypothetical protein